MRTAVAANEPERRPTTTTVGWHINTKTNTATSAAWAIINVQR